MTNKSTPKGAAGTCKDKNYSHSWYLRKKAGFAIVVLYGSFFAVHDNYLTYLRI